MTEHDPNTALASLEHYQRTHLEKLRLATEIILELGEREALPMPLESELFIFRDRVQLALLHPETSGDLLTWLKHEADADGDRRAVRGSDI